ncbi:hypothetical protein [Marinobacterium sp. BA1]|uniref:hypothetical protein n=1 Tax=Marinobacterium sp. BA1 TaxID=3138931 RepID=UPI0032E53EED
MNEDEVKQYIAQMKARTARLKQDPQAARRLLVKAGIITASGEIHPYYREFSHP